MQIIARFFLCVSRYFKVAIRYLLLNFNVRLISTFLMLELSKSMFINTFCMLRSIPHSKREEAIMNKTLRLISMPVNLRMQRITNANINARAFNLLIMPRKRNVIIAINVSGQITTFLRKRRMILTRITYRMTITTIIIIPDLTYRLRKSGRTNCKGSNNDERFLRLNMILGRASRSYRARAGPSNRNMRQANMNVIAFTQLTQDLIRMRRSNGANRRRRRRSRPRLLSTFLSAMNLP